MRLDLCASFYLPSPPFHNLLQSAWERGLDLWRSCPKIGLLIPSDCHKHKPGGEWREFVLAYRVMFNPPGLEVREVIHDLEHLNISA